MAQFELLRRANRQPSVDALYLLACMLSNELDEEHNSVYLKQANPFIQHQQLAFSMLTCGILLASRIGQANRSSRHDGLHAQSDPTLKHVVATVLHLFCFC